MSNLNAEECWKCRDRQAGLATGEIFEYVVHPSYADGGACYFVDVTEAYRYALRRRQLKGVQPVYTDREDAGFVRYMTEGGQLDELYAPHLEHVDEHVPGLMMTFRHALKTTGDVQLNQVIVDGNHRALRAYRRAARFYFYLLDEQESAPFYNRDLRSLVGEDRYAAAFMSALLASAAENP